MFLWLWATEHGIGDDGSEFYLHVCRLIYSCTSSVAWVAVEFARAVHGDFGKILWPERRGTVITVQYR